MKFLFVMLLIFSDFLESTSENFKVVAPAAPLVADAGEDLVLPCSIKPSISAEDMRVEWFRLHQTDNIVHVYDGYEDRNDDQMESYRGRTALFKEELRKGNTSLKLSALRLSDEGAYKCYIESVFLNDDVTVYVEVKGKGFHAWKIAIICISVFAITLIAFTGYILKDKFSKKKLSPKQCSVITYMRLQSENVKKELDLKKFNTSEEGYSRLIPAITNCRKAQFAGCNLTAQSLETLNTALQTENCSLKELDLSKNDLQDSGVEKLSAGLRSSHCKLEILRLAMCKLSQQSCNILQSVLQTETSSLKELDLSNNDLQDSGVERLSAGLKSSHCKLEKLRLALCNLGKYTCYTLGSTLQAETWSLKELDLSKNNLQDSGMEDLSHGLKSQLCKLEILRLAMCNFTLESCKSLTSALQTKISTLKELNLSNNELQDSVVELLSAGLKTGDCKLEILRLALCNLGEKTFENLGSLLKQENSALKELDLSNNDLQDSGMDLLSDGLKSSHCKLEILRLSGCMITEKGCSSLASALSSNSSHLKELDLTYNHPEESGVKLLSARLEDPQCSLSTLGVEHGGENRIKAGLKKYSCEVTLDPNTAHRELSLSDGNRKVLNVWEDHSYPDHPERFDGWEQVLCRESLTGRCYWEAEWSGGFDIAVTYKSISRKGGSTDCVFGRNVKSWILSCSNNSYSVWHNYISTELSARPSSSETVGVYLDCPAGSLSFYSISTDKLTHLHTFNTTFTEPLCAGFRVWDYGSSVCLK
ncbi:ribonuclease inhibitor-like [Colossoma macropomum]|uniref:ribonuclease inhibitor-like n=1 Tax=Colossoma macropomum TaxID=42526 RepID=UPI001864F9B6|nr:ribonuclease inhibitor-like [Colossoma macropomum]XP_036418409.1 ribonuclease inhibitor-like [Colossoma macropomum]XP_036418410.1 ribonuclease inhibitor-like [Colossoma macropomum]XP_036418411.1 ribonuclease inhibitor-like [Colossoma macropomum]XP_036418412.1 ribonuclease inhibitor-like [Colossoma macropomum]XP_036418413.1 ribonuclease inhibitor-like [Colossoma macropomum]